MTRFSEHELEWMADLDWSLYGASGQGFISSQRFLAQAVTDFAEITLEPWPSGIDHFLSHAGTIPRGEWRPSYLAFTRDDKPTSVYYDTVELVRTQARYFSVPLASIDSVTREEWDAVEDAADFDWSVGEGARLVLRQIATIFAQLAFDKLLGTWIAPVGGGNPAPLPHGVWRIDPSTAVKRLAKCGLSVNNPTDGDAPITHHIFVERSNHELRAAARTNYLDYLDVDFRLQREIDKEDVPTSAIKRYLRSLMIPANAHWDKFAFIDAIKAKFNCKLSVRKYQTIKDRLVAEDGAIDEAFTKRGRKRTH